MLKLAIPTPCTQAWDEMQPEAGGRHCASCRKVVQDFSQFTDAEVVAWFAQHEGPVCGRLRDGQLQTSLYDNQSVAATDGSHWLRWAVALVMGWQTAKAQQGPPTQDLTPPPLPVQVATTAKKVAAPVRTPDRGYTLYSIAGKVVDDQNHPLPGINVILKELNRGTVTDTSGAFTLTIYKADEGKPIRLFFTQIGLASQEMTVTPENRSALVVKMKEEIVAFMGEVVVTSYSRPPSPIRKVQHSLKRLFIRDK
ncbi:carboxypeptidase-like regulatory domain-containing protein [Fibrella aquatilis]|uniref:Carboxypeptidase-like regulatory domain-containing protein n=1 Tax=Fibrella aquatilis TaxID=2817059 RepID=A0A939K093_9BACT|nr:carboxypeptidase-like regulatory domain-containing protein [Fibrella aquatilis]MBO0933954.1 carboxypeptidase-like regulatory domain-containing protein [Fibrella aquatilis]